MSAVAYKSVRGMRDLVGADAALTSRVADAIAAVARSFGYEEIRLPLIESAELFSRGVGEATDIVEKEMYTLRDRRGRELALRPEGTASCARAAIEHGLLRNQAQRFWYAGPMFRYERQQRGRYRQFEQIGVEAFGIGGAAVEAELVQLAQAAWCALGIDGQVTLEVNTLGAGAARAAYRAALVEYLTPHAEALDADSRRRLTTNPLRILDSKVLATQQVLENAPRLADHVDAPARAHFDAFRELLDELRVPYRVNPRLVRGLDYYTHTVFEWTAGDIGAQDAVCAGGRYDGLVERLGGAATPAAGFAIGVDRVALLCAALADAAPFRPVDAYCAVLDEGCMAWALAATQRLRELAPGLRVRLHTGGGKAASQLRRADECGARWALIVGEREMADRRIAVKWLRERRPQALMRVEELAAELGAAYADGGGDAASWCEDVAGVAAQGGEPANALEEH